jgi:hypothetical protein
VTAELGTGPAVSADQWRDKKRHLWLMGLIAPTALFEVGPIVWAMNQFGWQSRVVHRLAQADAAPPHRCRPDSPGRSALHTSREPGLSRRVGGSGLDALRYCWQSGACCFVGTGRPQ